MNINIVKDEILSNIGRNIIVIVKGSRNRKEIYEGTLFKMYPNIFSICINGIEKTFSYADVVIKDVILKYK